jgi:hypothetical protein
MSSNILFGLFSVNVPEAADRVAVLDMAWTSNAALAKPVFLSAKLCGDLRRDIAGPG